MATSDDMPSETSPLLGLGSNGAAPKALNGHIISETIPNDASQDGADLERHDSIDERRAAQFEGRPDIRRQLKFILPAISIGVLKAPVRLVAPTDQSKGILICSRPNNHFFQLWQNRERTRCTQSHQLDCNVLLPNLVIIPTTLWEAKRHLRSKGVSTLVLRYIRPRVFVLWSGSGYQSIDCSPSEWKSYYQLQHANLWVGLSRHWRRRYDHRCQHLDERHYSSSR
jgi:hypothetical protein